MDGVHELYLIRDEYDNLKKQQMQIDDVSKVLDALKMNLQLFADSTEGHVSVDDRLVELSNKVQETSNLVEECYKKIEELSYVKLSNKSRFSSSSKYYVKPYDEYEEKSVPNKDTYYSYINSVGLYGLIREEIIITEERIADIEDSLYWTNTD